MEKEAIVPTILVYFFCLIFPWLLWMVIFSNILPNLTLQVYSLAISQVTVIILSWFLNFLIARKTDIWTYALAVSYSWIIYAFLNLYFLPRFHLLSDPWIAWDMLLLWCHMAFSATMVSWKAKYDPF